MKYTEHFYRGEPVYSEQLTLPSEVYNSMRLLFDYSEDDCVFVSLRHMQYLSMIDGKEVIFVDSHGERQIEFAWRIFQPQMRQALTDPVPFCLECYHAKGKESMKRALWEFNGAVKTLWDKRKKEQLRESGDQVLLFP